jgi:hypothetical protein
VDNIARDNQGKRRGNQCYNAVDEFLDTVVAIMNSENLGSILIHAEDMSYKDEMNSQTEVGLEHLLPEGEQIDTVFDQYELDADHILLTVKWRKGQGLYRVRDFRSKCKTLHSILPASHSQMKTFVRQITNPRPTPEELMMRELEVRKKKEDGKWKEK